MIRILHSVSNMDRAGIETMLMNYYRHIDRSKIQFDFLCNKKKPGAYDAEIKEMGGNIYHTPGLNPAKYPSYLKCMKKIFEENPEYKIVEAHNGALGVYALHAAKVNHIPVRIFHAHGASITRDWKLPIKLVCKALLPSNMNQHFSCGIEAARCYFGEKVVERNDYELIPNAIEVNRFVFDSTIRNRIRHDNHLENKHIVGHVGRFMSQKNHTFLLDVFAEVSKRDSLAHLVLLGDGELMDAMKEKASNLGIKDRVTFVGNVGNKAQKKQSIYFIKLTAIIVVGFVFNVICYNLYKVKESFAVGTLLSAVCWYFLCLPDFKWIKYNTKEKLYPFIQTCAFLVCGFCFSAIPGFFIYIFEIMVVTWISFPKETKFIINEAKSKLAHLK